MQIIATENAIHSAWLKYSIINEYFESLTMNVKEEFLEQSNKDERKTEENSIKELSSSNFKNILNAGYSTLTSEAVTIAQPIVSHTTGSIKSVNSILKEGIQLKSHPGNLYGGKAFYVAEGGFSTHEVWPADYTIAFRWSRNANIFDTERGALKPPTKGFDAYKYEGSFIKANGIYHDNFAIVRNPQYLTPIGVYPEPLPSRSSAFSLPTIRGIQALGVIGTGYSLFHAGESIIESEQPFVETGYQAALLGAAIMGAKKSGMAAIKPCAALGKKFVPAAPYIVPVCTAGASILGGLTAATSADMVLHTGNDTLNNMYQTINDNHKQHLENSNDNIAETLLQEGIILSFASSGAYIGGLIGTYASGACGLGAPACAPITFNAGVALGAFAGGEIGKLYCNVAKNFSNYIHYTHINSDLTDETHSISPGYFWDDLFGSAIGNYNGNEATTKIYDIKRNGHQDLKRSSSNQESFFFFKNISFLSAANATVQPTKHDSFLSKRTKGTLMMKKQLNGKDQKNNSSGELHKHINNKANQVSNKLSTPTKQSQKQLTDSSLDPRLMLQMSKQANTKLEEIYKNNADSEIKLSQILGEIHASYQTIHQLKLMHEQKQKAEIANANFQSVMQGFNLITTIGRVADNKTIERIGAIGLSLAQGTFGVAQLTGAFGVEAVVGFSMMGPTVAIAASALALGSMLFSSRKNKKQSKAMQKMFQNLSNQITQIHHDFCVLNKNMIGGFRAVMTGIDTINKNLDMGFNSVHEAMSKYFSNTTKQLTVLAELSNQQYENISSRINKGIEAIIESQISIFKVVQRDFLELDFKLDDQNLFLNTMSGELKDISADLQKLGFKEEEATKNKMFILLERFQLLLNDKDSKKRKPLLKLLQSIRGQLLLANNSLKSLEIKSNSFSGWFHLSALKLLFSEPDFHRFSFDYENIINPQWSQFAYNCLFTLLLSHQDFSDPTIIRLKTEIINLIKRTTKPTIQLIQVLSGEDFLKTFFTHHRKKLSAIHELAETILRPLREQMSQSAMRDYAERLLSGFQQSDHKSALLQLVEENTKGISEQMTQHVQEELISLIKEYNNCIQTLKVQTNVILSLLEIDMNNIKSIKRKFSSLQPIPELCYRSRGVVDAKHDPSLPESVVYSYVNVDTTNHFKSIEITSEDLPQLLENAKDYADMTKAYLELVNSISSTDETVDLDMLFLEEPFVFQPIEYKSREETMKSKSTLNTNTIDELIQLMNPVFDIALHAKGKTIYYVMGITGDGKSTLLNCLNGTRYEEEDELGDTVPKKITESAPEICKVGTNIAVSETLFPQLLEIPYGDKTIHYCDLPGLDGSRDEATTVCEAYAPMILNEQVANVGGIIWVLSADQFKATKAEKIKEMLQNLLKISKDDPKILAKSLTLVVTKGSEKLKKEHVAIRIKKIIDGMTNAEEKEKQLLTEILDQISKDGSKQIVITQIFDEDSRYLDELQQAVLNHEPVDKNHFDFSAYCKTQESFKEKLETAMKQYQSLRSDYEKMSHQVIQCAAMYNLKSDAQEKLYDQQEKLKIAHRSYVSQLEEKQNEAALIQVRIAEIDSSRDLVKIGEIKRSIQPLTRTREIEEPTGQVELRDTGRFEPCTRKEQKKVETKRLVDTKVYPPNGRYIHPSRTGPKTLYGHWVKEKELQGYTVDTESRTKVVGQGKKRHTITKQRAVAKKYTTDISFDEIEVPDQRSIRVEVPLTRRTTVTEPLPLGNLAESTLSFLSSLAVDVNTKTTNQGWTIKPGTESKQNGYQATILYEQGKGCEIDLDIRINNRDSEEGRQEFSVLKSEKNRLDREILLLRQQTEELSFKIKKNQEAIGALETQLPILEEQKAQLDKEFKEFTAYMASKQHDFEKLNVLNAILNKDHSLKADTNNDNSFTLVDNGENEVEKPSSSFNANNTIDMLQDVQLPRTYPLPLSSGGRYGLFSSTKFSHNQTPNFNNLPVLYDDIETRGDGNCCFNGIALGICDLIQLNLLAKQNPIYQQLEYRFLSDLHANTVTPIGDITLEEWIKTHPDSSERQLTLAPYLRTMAIEIIMSQYDNYRVGYQERLLDACFNYMNFGVEDDTFTVHQHIRNKCDEFKRQPLFNKNNLLNWWESIGKNEYFQVLVQPAMGGLDTSRWAGEVEIGALAAALDINIRWRKGNGSQQLGIGGGFIPRNSLTEEEIKQLTNHGIGQLYLNNFRINFFEDPEKLEEQLSAIQNYDKIVPVINQFLIDKPIGQIPFPQQLPGIDDISSLQNQLVERGILTIKDDVYLFISERDEIYERMRGIAEELKDKVRKARVDAPEMCLTYRAGHWTYARSKEHAKQLELQSDMPNNSDVGALRAI